MTPEQMLLALKAGEVQDDYSGFLKKIEESL